MPSNIQGMIQTLVMLKEVQQREQAQKLAEQQFAFAQNQGAVTNQVSHTQVAETLQRMFQALGNPQSMLPYAQQLAGSMGMTPEATTTLIQGLSPTVPTQQAAATRDALAASPELRTQAGTIGATGQGVGANQHDELLGTIFGGARGHLQTMSPEQLNGFHQGVLQRVGTGQSITDAAVDQSVMNASPEDIANARKIGMHLMPGAAEDQQNKLGWATLTLQNQQMQVNAALMELERRAQLMTASKNLDKNQIEEADKILTRRDELVQKLQSSSGTLTPEGRKQMIVNLNSYNEALRKIDPATWGPQGTHPQNDLDEKATIGATGILPFLGQYIKQQSK